MGSEEGVAAQMTRVTIDLDVAVLDALDTVKVQLGLRSRGYLINQLLKELLISEQHPIEECEVGK